jgi:hypothetical protein
VPWKAPRWTRWCGASSRAAAAGGRCSCPRPRSGSSASRPSGCCSRSPTSCASTLLSRSAVSALSASLPPRFRFQLVPVSFGPVVDACAFHAFLWHAGMRRIVADCRGWVSINGIRVIREKCRFRDSLIGPIILFI